MLIYNHSFTPPAPVSKSHIQFCSRYTAQWWLVQDCLNKEEWEALLAKLWMLPSIRGKGSFVYRIWRSLLLSKPFFYFIDMNGSASHGPLGSWAQWEKKEKCVFIQYVFLAVMSLLTTPLIHFCFFLTLVYTFCWSVFTILHHLNNYIGGIQICFSTSIFLSSKSTFQLVATGHFHLAIS